jgi:hypothetical protein
MPGQTADLLDAVNALRPAGAGVGEMKAKGSESESWLAPSILTALNDRAAINNNEME